MNMKTKCETFEKLNEAVLEKGLIVGVHSIFGKDAKIRLGFSTKVCFTNIDELELSVRGYNALKRNGVNTLGEAIDALTDGRLMSFRNLGRKTYIETKAKIIDFGYNSLSEKEKKIFLMDIVEINTKG